AARLGAARQAERDHPRHAQVQSSRSRAARAEARGMEPAGGVAAGPDPRGAAARERPGVPQLPAARAHGGEARGRPGRIAYIVRRVLYVIPILVLVNLFTFWLFFAVNTPDDMARLQLGVRRVTQEAVDKWKAEHGYDKPMVYNGSAEGLKRLTDTVFFEKSVRLFVFDFGNADDGRSIRNAILTRMWPSLAVQLPVFLVGLAVYISFALLMAFFRATYIDFWGVIV